MSEGRVSGRSYLHFFTLHLLGQLINDLGKLCNTSVKFTYFWMWKKVLLKWSQAISQHLYINKQLKHIKWLETSSLWARGTEGLGCHSTNTHTALQYGGWCLISLLSTKSWHSSFNSFVCVAESDSRTRILLNSSKNSPGTGCSIFAIFSCCLETAYYLSNTKSLNYRCLCS